MQIRGLKTKSILLIGLLLGALNGYSQTLQNQEYIQLSQPQLTETGKAVEVIEFFWYGCPHCYHLEPGLNEWIKKLPKEVKFRRIHAVLGGSWAPHAKIFYTLQALGELDRLHKAVFDAIHKEKIELRDEKVLADWIAKQGVDPKKFSQAYHSFGVESDVRRASQLVKSYEVNSVPTLIVNGKYLTSVTLTGSEDRLFQVLDELIKKSRATTRVAK